jgi:SAM-dependent methyltransferase
MLSVVDFAKQTIDRLRRRTPAELVVTHISNQTEFQAHTARNQAEAAARRKAELGLAQPTSRFNTPGFCFVCGQWTEFSSTWEYAYDIEGKRHVNWREHLLCPGCSLNNRLRATVHLLALIGLTKGARIYITEQSSALFRHLQTRFPFVIGSEHLGAAVARGQTNAAGIRNEDLTRLTFCSGTMDAVMSFDVFEHIPNYEKAFAECVRILKPGGKMLFCVPFDSTSARNRIRARVNPDGTIEHLAPPEYHYDPLNAEGCLCFQHFGWEMLEQLKQAGFAKVSALCYYSRDYGYIGGEQIQFLAEL